MSNIKDYSAKYFSDITGTKKQAKTFRWNKNDLKLDLNFLFKKKKSKDFHFELAFIICISGTS